MRSSRQRAELLPLVSGVPRPLPIQQKVKVKAQTPEEQRTGREEGVRKGRLEGWLGGRILDCGSVLRKFSKADGTSEAKMACSKVPHFPAMGLP